MNPYDIVTEFENQMALYTGAPHAIAVDSCTNALMLCLAAKKATTVTCPKKTYVGVAQSILNAGHKLAFTREPWESAYYLKPFNIVDSALRLYRNMYVDYWQDEVCLSFHWAKPLPIGRGGMILTDNLEAANLYRKMRFDGRTAGVVPNRDTFVRGYHCMMSPQDAAQGLALMMYIEDDYEVDKGDYGDLSLQGIFK